MSWQTILAIGSGGFIGAVMRAWLNGVISSQFPHNLPVGTLGVNLLGSFILGVLFAIFTYTNLVEPNLKSFLSTGMMGALTTYSTFAIETFWLFQGGSFVLGISNMLLNVVGTVLLAGSGYKLGASLLS